MSSDSSHEEFLAAPDAWMLTLSDLLLLLLSMFVMMLSMAEIDASKLHKKTPQAAETTEAPPTGPSQPTQKTLLASLEPLRKEGAAAANRGIRKDRPELFTVSLAHSFTAEDSELTFDAVEVLLAVARTVKEGRLGVTVELFLPQLANGGSAPDQRLIVERARVVIRQLIDAGVEREALAIRVSVTPMTPDQASEGKGSGGLRLYLLSREA